MATPNTFPCPNCRGDVNEPEDVNKWDFQERSDGANFWTGEQATTCPHCGAVLTVTFGGTSVGHPDQGEPVENIELVDIELVEEPAPDLDHFFERIDGDSLEVVPSGSKGRPGFLVVQELDRAGVVYLQGIVAEGDALVETFEAISLKTPYGAHDIEAFETGTILDDGVTTLPLVMRGGVIRQVEGVMLDDPDDAYDDDMACYRGDAVSLRSCLTCSGFGNWGHRCRKLDTYISSTEERRRTGCAGWEQKPRRAEPCPHRDDCDGPCDECAGSQGVQ